MRQERSDDGFVVNVSDKVPFCWIPRLILTFKSVSNVPGRCCAGVYLVSLVTASSSHPSLVKPQLYFAALADIKYNFSRIESCDTSRRDQKLESAMRLQVACKCDAPRVSPRCSYYPSLEIHLTLFILDLYHYVRAFVLKDKD